VEKEKEQWVAYMGDLSKRRWKLTVNDDLIWRLSAGTRGGDHRNWILNGHKLVVHHSEGRPVILSEVPFEDFNKNIHLSGGLLIPLLYRLRVLPWIARVTAWVNEGTSHLEVKVLGDQSIKKKENDG